MLDEVLYSADLNERNPQLAVECWFYAVVYKPQKCYYESLQTLKTILKSGIQSVGMK